MKKGSFNFENSKNLTSPHLNDFVQKIFLVGAETFSKIKVLSSLKLFRFHFCINGSPEK